MRTARDGMLWYRKRASLFIRNNWITICVLFGIVFSSVLIACTNAETADTSSGIIWHSIGVSRSYTEIYLVDGTRCAVYDSGNGGGIDCNWNSND